MGILASGSHNFFTSSGAITGYGVLVILVICAFLLILINRHK